MHYFYINLNLKLYHLKNKTKINHIQSLESIDTYKNFN